MYDLPQAGSLANKFLKKHLNKHGYQQSKLVTGIWKHKTRPIQFSLVLDDFGVKYVGKEHAQHLKNPLKEHYKLTFDWTGKLYIWYNIGLGLQQIPGSSIHAKLRAESFETISTQSRQTTACTISECTDSIWCKETICNTRIKGTTVRQQSQAVHPTGMWQVFFPQQSS
jgi:hypothetical protein